MPLPTRFVFSILLDSFDCSVQHCQKFGKMRLLFISIYFQIISPLKRFQTLTGARCWVVIKTCFDVNNLQCLSQSSVGFVHSPILFDVLTEAVLIATHVVAQHLPPGFIQAENFDLLGIILLFSRHFTHIFKQASSVQCFLPHITFFTNNKKQ